MMAKTRMMMKTAITAPMNAGLLLLLLLLSDIDSAFAESSVSALLHFSANNTSTFTYI